VAAAVKTKLDAATTEDDIRAAFEVNATEAPQIQTSVEILEQDDTNIKALADAINSMAAAMKGGDGSGNFGHAGRPGEIGGSAPGMGGPKPFNEWVTDTFKHPYAQEGIFAAQYESYVSRWKPTREESVSETQHSWNDRKPVETYGDFKEKVRAFIEKENAVGRKYDYYGLRFEDKDRRVGDSVNNSMHNPDRSDERDFPEYGTPEYSNMIDLGGSSSWRIDMDGNDEDWINGIMLRGDSDSDKISQGGHVYIIAGNDNVTHSDADPNEIVIAGAVVRKKIF
jgi:hypothetical protein